MSYLSEYNRATGRSNMPIGVALIVLLLVLAGMVGWVLNFIKFVAGLSGEPTLFLLGRAFGLVFAPLGAVLGYL